MGGCAVPSSRRAVHREDDGLVPRELHVELVAGVAERLAEPDRGERVLGGEAAAAAVREDAKPGIAGVAFEIDRDAALVAIEEVEVRRVARGHSARLIAFAGPFHLHDIGAEIREQESRRGACDDVAELQHAQSFEGE